MAAGRIEKIDELESIRGLAALMVVLFHMPAWHPALYEPSFIRNSYYMVDLFFVLSGFVIFINYGHRLNTAKDLIKFQVLRFGRLYPVHLAFLFVALFMAIAKWLAATYLGMALPNGGAFKDAGFTAFFEHLFLVQSLGFTDSSHQYNEASWSISVEFYTYLIFALICLSFKGVIRIVVFAAITAAAMWMLYSLGHATGNFSPILQCLAGFFLGCLTALLGRHVRRNLPSFAILVGIGIIVVFTCLADSPQFNVLIFPLSALLILSVLASREGWFKTLLQHRVFTFLGLISYSVYMSHFCVLWFCNIFIRVVFGLPERMTDGVSYPQLPFLPALLAASIAVALTILLSVVVFRYLEDPMRRYSRDWVKKRFAD